MRYNLIVSAVLASSVLVGCPNPPECSVSEPCGEGRVCQEGACIAGEGAPDGGGTCRDTSNRAAPNVLENPGFECGIEGWDVLFEGQGKFTRETAVTRSGQGAARLTATSSGTTQFVQLAGTRDVVPGSVWCASAWMRGTASDGRLTIRRVGSNQQQNAFTPVTNDEWSRTSSPFKITIEPADTELILFVAMPYPKAGDSLLVDDVALWQSKDGSCTER
ncbi:MAG: hypothetical protein WBV82_22330 [Myxococcaceae bacterium]